MRSSKLVLTAVLACVAMGSVACSLQIDQIFAMQEGSGVDVFLPDGNVDLFQGRLAFEGGTVMRIHISTTLFDYLDGTVDGDVEILDLLFGVPGFRFVIFSTGLICVALDDPPGGGSFTYDVLAEEATFDMIVNTKAVVTNLILARLLRDGAFKFPFHLQSTIPLPLVDALGMFTGTGSLEVTQALDDYYEARIAIVKDDPSRDLVYTIHVKGEVTLATTDTFPVTPNVLACIDYLGS